MDAYRPDRIVKTLTFIVSTLYFLSWGAAALVLLGVPLIRVFSASDPNPFILDLPVNIGSMPTTLAPTWAPDATGMKIEDVTGFLQVPIGIVPRHVLIVLWAEVATMFALFILFMHHLRRLFVRVRDGAPFDARNAVRLRWLGALIVAMEVAYSAFTFWESALITSPRASPTVIVESTLDFDWSVLFVGLVLLALAEIFRRGTTLEEEQSLVI